MDVFRLAKLGSLKAHAFLLVRFFIDGELSATVEPLRKTYPELTYMSGAPAQFNEVPPNCT